MRLVIGYSPGEQRCWRRWVREILRPEAAISAKTALVGGGASGIGRAVADRLAGSGHALAITGRNEARLHTAAIEIHERYGVPVDYLVHDLADRDSAAVLVEQAEKLLDGVDVAVINAGGPPPGRILAIDDEQWRAAFELLVLGPVSLARSLLPVMAARGFGRIITTTSTAVRQPQPDLSLSVVLRAAVTSAMKLLSLEHAAEGVTVNCVAPGATDTGRRREILRSRAAATGRSIEDIERADAQDVPAGRAGSPAEIAAAITFLASVDAGYVNGTVLTVDGGRTETI